MHQELSTSLDMHTNILAMHISRIKELLSNQLKHVVLFIVLWGDKWYKFYFSLYKESIQNLHI